MTISSEINKDRYVGNGTATVFSYSFKIVDADHIVVKIADEDDVATTLVENTHYTLSGVGSDGGGDVTLLDLTALVGSSALPSDYSLTLLREIPLLQDIDLNNQGNFYAETHEQFFDKIMMICQQLKEQIDRAYVVSETSGVDPASLDEALAVSIAAAEAAQAAAETAQGLAEAAQADAEAAQAAAELAEDGAQAAAQGEVQAIYVPETVEDIASLGAITITNTMYQVRPIQGDSAPVSASGTPFGVNPLLFSDGMIIVLQGADSINTVTLWHNDAQYGLIMNGDYDLSAYSEIIFRYSATLERFIERQRNDL